MYSTTAAVTQRGQIWDFDNKPYLQESFTVTIDSNNRNFNVSGSSPANFTVQLPCRLRQIRAVELRQAVFSVPANQTNPSPPPATIAFADNIVAVHLFFNGSSIGNLVGTNPAGTQLPAVVPSIDYTSGAFCEIVLNVGAGGTERFEMGDRLRVARRWSSRPFDSVDIIGIQLRDRNDNLWLLEDANTPVPGTDRVYFQLEILAGRA